MQIIGIEHAPSRADGIKEAIASEGLADMSVEIAQIYSDCSLRPIEEVDALILSGGPMGVYQLKEPQYDYFGKEIEYIEKAISLGKPILGICFGHQLLASIMGGEVIRNEEKREVGWYDIEIKDPRSPIFLEIKNPLHVFQFHNDHVIKAPACSEVIASSTNCNIQALRYKDYPIYSVQFHPEIDIEKGREILKKRNQPEDRYFPKKDIKDRTKIFRNFLISTLDN